MGRFDVIEEHVVRGTKQTLHLRAMSAESTVEFRGSVLATLVADKDGGEKTSTMDEILKVQAANIAAHAFDDAACSSRTWDDRDGVLRDLSAAQIEDVGEHLLAISGFNVQAATAARRFQDDGAGAPGSVPVAQHGEGLRDDPVEADGAAVG